MEKKIKIIKNIQEQKIILNNMYGIILEDSASFLTKGGGGKYYEGTERSIWI